MGRAEDNTTPAGETSPNRKQRAAAATRKLSSKAWQRIHRRSVLNPHQTFRLTPRKTKGALRRDMRASWRLLADTTLFIKANWRFFGSIVLLYALISYVIVGGVTQLDYINLREGIKEVFNGKLDSWSNIFATFGQVIGLSQPASQIQQLLSGLLTLFFWLTIVWAARRLMAHKATTLRQALYSSGAPIAATIVLLLVMTLQVLPAAFGLFIYAVVTGGQLLGSGVEGLIFGVAAVLLLTVSLYWATSTFIALIIATLPGMYPMRALREARDLVVGRRQRILVRLLVLGVIGVAVWLILLVPAILFDSWLKIPFIPVVPILVQLLAGVTLLFTSTYIYRLYRSLL